MEKWRCSICGYIYDLQLGDTEYGIEPGRFFSALPEYWGCPDCGASKEYFEQIDDDIISNKDSGGN
ncbi:MAG: rubredoxin [bacterium]